MSTLPYRLEGSSIPRVRKGADVFDANLSPTDAFVIFRIDGNSTVRQLAEIAGLDEEHAQAVVARLAALGLVEIEIASGERRRSEALGAGGAPVGGVVEEVTGAYDPAELYEDVEIPIPRRKRILDAFYAVDQIDHYEALGIDTSADKKGVRLAYFALSKIFHTDTLYGKSLGSYKHKMDVVFKRITQAYNVLSKPASRADYDAYLGSVKGTRAARSAIDAALGLSDPSPTASAAKATAASASTAVASPSPTPASPPPAPLRAAPPAAAAAPSSEAARRRARELYARKLSSTRTGARAPAATSSAPPAHPAKPRDAAEVARDLQRALVSTSQHTGGVSQGKRLAQDAARAEEAGDLVAAANAYRLAQELEPDDVDIGARFRRVSHDLRMQMLPEFQRQAQYEERNGDFAAAAISWRRVATTLPDDPVSQSAAARCLRKSNGDLKLQQQFARRAAELLPDDFSARLLLGQVYLDAEMPLSAKRELEAAAKLDPNDETVKKLLVELKQKLR